MKDAMKGIGRFDSKLVEIAVRQLQHESSNITETDLKAVKKALGKIIDSLPDDKDKSGILLKALKEIKVSEKEQELEKIKKSLRELNQETLKEITSQYVVKRATPGCDIEDQACWPFANICGPFAEIYADLDPERSKTEDPEDPKCGEYLPPYMVQEKDIDLRLDAIEKTIRMYPSLKKRLLSMCREIEDLDES